MNAILGRAMAITFVILAASCGGQEFADPETECRTPDDGAVLCLFAAEHGPVGRLVTADEEVKAALGSFCWSMDGAGGCGDIGEIPDLATPVTIAIGSKLSLIEDADRVSAEVGELEVVDGVRQLTNLADLDLSAGSLQVAPGSYVIDVFARWEQGDGELFFPVEVVAD
jgi:hypothetical protein